MISQRTIVVISMTVAVSVHAVAIGLAIKFNRPLQPYIRLSKYSAREIDSQQSPENDQTPTQPSVIPPENTLIMGTLMGIGHADQDTPGDQQTALESLFDQAATSRDAQNAPSEQSASPEQPEFKMQGLQIAEPVELHGVSSQAGQENLAIGHPNSRRGLAGQSTHALSTSSHPDQSQGDPTQTSNPRQPAAQQPIDPAQITASTAGQALPQTGSDSDLFSDKLDIVMRAGKMTARQGRQVKLKNPRFNLAGVGDATTLSFPVECIISIQLDENGRVRRVLIEKSTGSRSLDLAIELAAYEWWIQPLTRNGKPVAQTITVPYTIY